MKCLFHLIFILLPCSSFCQYDSVIFKDTAGRTGVFLSYDELKKMSPSIVIHRDKKERLVFTFPKGLHTIEAIVKDTVIPQNLRGFSVEKKEGGMKYIFKAGSVYGYYNEGEIFRYYAEPKNWRINDGYYKIEEAGTFVIYSIRKRNLLSSTKHYYYSLNLNSPLKYLNQKNIEADIKDTVTFNKIMQNKKLAKDIQVRDADGKFLLNKELTKNNR